MPGTLTGPQDRIGRKTYILASSQMEISKLTGKIVKEEGKKEKCFIP